MKKKLKVKNILKKIKSSLHIIYLLILIILMVASRYMKVNFSNETIDELIFYLNNGVNNSDSTVYINALKECWIYLVVLIFFVIGLFYNYLNNKNLILKFVFKKKKEHKIKIYPINIVRKHRIISTIVFTLIALLFISYNMKLFNYFKNNIVSSDFIEANYVDPEETKVTFDKKKNLVMIFIESLEMTFFTKEQGGDWDYEVIPELYDLLFEKDSVYFATDDKVGGMLNLETTTWTTGSVVSNTSGLPFKIPIDNNSYHSDRFMIGAYNLGDLLKDNGYYNELISAAYTDFGGIGEYFSNHGSYNIIDVNNLDDVDLKFTKEDEGSWGFNDRYMFNVAKERLEKISKKDEPFNMTLIGIDTHFVDGFKGVYTTDEFDTQYENVYATESKLIYDFVSWIKKQDFYKDTTIVVLGDHISMQTPFFSGHDQDLRKRYFVVINSDVSTINYKNRQYTSLDTFPTVVAAIGGNIEGNRLALGTNLFSMRKTLSEQYSFKEVNREIAKKSPFYNNLILGRDYQEMIKNNEVEEE